MEKEVIMSSLSRDQLLKLKKKNNAVVVGRKPSKIEKKPGPDYTVLIKCVDTGVGRWVKPQDAFHVKRSKKAQEDHNREKRRRYQQKRRRTTKSKQAA